MQTETAIHPFERVGLGKAPFRYIGVIDQQVTNAGTVVVGDWNGIQVETKPGGSCDYCGLAIINMYNVRSADGKTFKVGCDCLKKVDIVNPVKLKTDIKKAKEAKADARIAEAKNVIETDAVRNALSSKPHPAPWGQAKGLTLLEYVTWMLVNAGRTGKTDAAKIIERTMKAAS